MRNNHFPRYRRHEGFTLVELLVATTILLLLMFVIFSTLDQTGRLWKNTTQKVETFQGARAAFEAVTRNLGQATLNAYWKVQTEGTPGSERRAYRRISDLHFMVGQAKDFFGSDKPENHPTHALFFQSPVGYTASESYEGLDELLSACGYFVEFGKDRSLPPHLDPDKGGGKVPTPPLRHRYRLMQTLQPSEELTVYGYDPHKKPDTTNDPLAWITKPLSINPEVRPVRAMAENVVAMVVVPKLSKADQDANTGPARFDFPDYSYDSRDIAPGKETSLHQLPPIVQVTLVAVDEASATQKQGISPIAPGFADGLFLKAQNEAEVAADLELLVVNLKKDRMNYRIFTTDVTIRASKWSLTDKP